MLLIHSRPFFALLAGIVPLIFCELFLLPSADNVLRHLCRQFQTTALELFFEGGKISRQRTFSIAPANGSYDVAVSGNNELRRQNHLYVFCLINGETKETANPMDLENWEFYVVPTAFLDQHCQNNKTISLGHIRSFGFQKIDYGHLKQEIDRVIDAL